MSAVEALVDSPSTEVKPGDSPYKGLDYYRKEDKDRFAGRLADGFELTARIATRRALVLYGRSGLGKTSLLLAGFFRALSDQGYQPVYVRTLQHPLEDLKSAIRTTFALTGDRDQGLKQLVEAASEDGTVLLVLDQFEEFFIRFGSDRTLRADFVAAVADLIR